MQMIDFIVGANEESKCKQIQFHRSCKRLKLKPISEFRVKPKLENFLYFFFFAPKFNFNAFFRYLTGLIIKMGKV